MYGFFLALHPVLLEENLLPLSCVTKGSVRVNAHCRSFLWSCGRRCSSDTAAMVMMRSRLRDLARCIAPNLRKNSWSHHQFDPTAHGQHMWRFTLNNTPLTASGEIPPPFHSITRYSTSILSTWNFWWTYDKRTGHFFTNEHVNIRCSKNPYTSQSNRFFEFQSDP